MMKRIIYIKSTGEIIAKTETYQDIKTLYKEDTIEYINSLGSIIAENPPKKLNLYKVIDGQLVKKVRKPRLIKPEQTLEDRIIELEKVIDSLKDGGTNAI